MKREAYFDNAKVLLIYLVVFGHMIQPFVKESYVIYTLYLWVYTFSMPAFIFLAGFFAKGSGNMNYILGLAKKLLVPYLVFQLLYSGYYLFIGKSGWQTSLFDPHWSLWFLFSLFSWHLLLIIFKKIPATWSIAIAILIGLVIGYDDKIGHSFSLSRTFVFFPYFLVGYWMTKEKLMQVKRLRVKIFASIILISVAIAIYLTPHIHAGWLLASTSYLDLGVPTYGGIGRLIVYITSTLMVISVLAFIPIKWNPLSYLGRRTLYVYLLHGFFIQFFREADVFSLNNMIDLIGLSLISALIVFLLSSKPMMGIWEPFIEGKVTFLKSKLEN